MRNIFALSELIKREIPDSHEEARFAIDALLEKYKYKAPEQWQPWFSSMAELLTGYLGPPDTPWKQKVADIFADRFPPAPWPGRGI